MPNHKRDCQKKSPNCFLLQTTKCKTFFFPGEYVNFVTISVWDETFGFILALVVFFATLKFIKMLKFNKRMGMLGDTILLATKDLKTFCVIFFIYFFAFSQCAFQLFGKVSFLWRVQVTQDLSV